MNSLLSLLLVSVSLWGAEPPPPGDPPPDERDGLPPLQRDDHGPGGWGRGPRGRGPGGPPSLGPIRQGENWVIFGMIKTAADGEKAPFDPSKGPVELELKDGRKITIDILPPPPHPHITPQARRMDQRVHHTVLLRERVVPRAHHTGLRMGLRKDREVPKDMVPREAPSAR